MINGLHVMNSNSPGQQAIKLNGTAVASKPAKPPKRMIPQELLQEFKVAIQGSDLTKIALVEALKKQYVYPPLPSDSQPFFT